MQDHLKKSSRAFAVIFVGFVILSSLPGIIAFADAFRNWTEEIWQMRLMGKNRAWIENGKKVTPPYPVAAAKAKKTPEQAEPEAVVEKQPSLLDRIHSKAKEKRDEYEDIIVKAYPFRYEFSTMNGSFKHLLGMRAPYSEAAFVIQRQDRVSISSVFREGDSFPTTQLERYKATADRLNIPFLVVIHPAQCGLTDEPLYFGLTPRDNAMIDNTLKNLDLDHLAVYDQRKDFIRQGFRHEDIYYRGDHHWNVQGALAGAGFLAKYLNENYGTDYKLQYFDKSFYHKEIFKNTSLGSIGKKVTMAYTGGLEDFEIFHPAWKTRFTVEYIRRKYQKEVTETRAVTGDFKTTMIDYSWLFGNPHKANLYGMFLSADNYLVRIKNHDYPNGKKILFIKDSFANAMLPYLALQTKEIILLDERHTGKDIDMILKREKPDLIIYCNMFFDELK